jgi:hypothetical protein
VCAVNLSSVNALYVTMSSYVVPSCLIVVVSIALVIARRRAKSNIDESDYSYPDNYTRLGTAGCRMSDSHDYDVIPDCIGCDRSDTSCGMYA